MKYAAYEKESPIGYAPGVFPAMELFTKASKLAVALLLHPNGMESTGIEKLAKIARSLGIPVEEAPRAIRRISGKDNCYAVGVFEKSEAPLSQYDDHLVLAQIADMGNLGTNLRTALGFGIRDIALIRPAADAFDPRAVRASMGALFGVRIQYFDSFEQYADRYERLRFFFRTKNACPLRQAHRSTGPIDLVFGNEASGLPESLMRSETGVKIEQTGDIDSLNLSVAVGIGLHYFSGGGE